MAAKTLPLQGGPRRCKASSGGKPKEKRVGFRAPRAAGVCETSVSGFCWSGRIFAALVCLGECEVFASELALAEARDPKSGPRFGAALPFSQNDLRKGAARRTMVLLLLGMFTRDALEHIAILESFKPTALDRASPASFKRRRGGPKFGAALPFGD